jgi:hypothetical protein
MGAGKKDVFSRGNHSDSLINKRIKIVLFSALMRLNE